MSAYKVVECDITDEKHIVEGLLDMGFSQDEIEIHSESVPLMDWQGSQSSRKANIIVRRENFKKRTRAHYNADLGFEKVEGKYTIHMNQEERPWWAEKEPRFKQVAAALKVEQEAKKRGYQVRRQEVDNKIKLRLIKSY